MSKDSQNGRKVKDTDEGLQKPSEEKIEVKDETQWPDYREEDSGRGPRTFLNLYLVRTPGLNASEELEDNRLIRLYENEIYEFRRCSKPVAGETPEASTPQEAPGIVTEKGAQVTHRILLPRRGRDRVDNSMPGSRAAARIMFSPNMRRGGPFQIFVDPDKPAGSRNKYLIVDQEKVGSGQSRMLHEGSLISSPSGRTVFKLRPSREWEQSYGSDLSLLELDSREEDAVQKRDAAHLPGLDQKTLPKLIRSAPKADEAFEDAEVMAKFRVPTLLLGETGTGKEVMAKHMACWAMEDKKAYFQVINCTVFGRDANTMISALFGHEKDAFTGANKERKGIIRLAADEKAVLFIDEVHALPLEAQGRLLRFLSEGDIQPLGSDRVIRLDRSKIPLVICAAKPVLVEMMRQSPPTFLPDLFHRLAGHVIRLPTLIQRKEDILKLAEEFLDQLPQRHKPKFVLASETERRLTGGHSFTGNIRELEMAMRRAAAFAMADNPEIRDKVADPEAITVTIEPKHLRLEAIPDILHRADTWEDMEWDGYVRAYLSRGQNYKQLRQEMYAEARNGENKGALRKRLERSRDKLCKKIKTTDDDNKLPSLAAELLVLWRETSANTEDGKEELLVQLRDPDSLLGKTRERPGDDVLRKLIEEVENL